MHGAGTQAQVGDDAIILDDGPVPSVPELCRALAAPKQVAATPTELLSEFTQVHSVDARAPEKEPNPNFWNARLNR